jgi:hypothetical protein
MKVEWVPFADRKHVTRRGAHNLSGKILKWNYCTRCGLIALRNHATALALRAQCEWIDDD